MQSFHELLDYNFHVVLSTWMRSAWAQSASVCQRKGNRQNSDNEPLHFSLQIRCKMLVLPWRQFTSSRGRGVPFPLFINAHWLPPQQTMDIMSLLPHVLGRLIKLERERWESGLSEQPSFWPIIGSPCSTSNAYRFTVWLYSLKIMWMHRKHPLVCQLFQKQPRLIASCL